MNYGDVKIFWVFFINSKPHAYNNWYEKNDDCLTPITKKEIEKIDKRGGGNKSKNIKRDAWLSEKEVWENQDWFDRRF